MTRKKDGSDRTVDVVLEAEGKPGIAEKVPVPPKDVQEAFKVWMNEVADQMRQATANLTVQVPGVGTLNLGCGSARGELAQNAVWLVEVGEEVQRRLAPKVQKYLEAEEERRRVAREQSIKEAQEYHRAVTSMMEPNTIRPEGERVVYAKETAKAEDPCGADSPSAESDKT